MKASGAVYAVVGSVSQGERFDPRPGIENSNAGEHKVGHISGHDRHAVHQGRGRDQGVAFGARIEHMKSRATLRHRCVDAQHAPKGR